MGRVDGPPHIEIDVGGFLKEHPADHRGPVAAEAPFLVQLVLAECVLGVFDDLVDGDDALGDKVNALDLGGGRHVAALEIEAGLERLAEVLGGDR